MGDQRFENRIKRIGNKDVSRQKSPHLLAGVGDVEESNDVAMGRKPRKRAGQKSASVLLMITGAVIGFAAFKVIRDLVGMDSLMTLPPNMLANIAMTDPVVGSAGAVLAFLVLLALYGTLRGRAGLNFMGFGWSGIGAVLGSASVALL